MYFHVYLIYRFTRTFTDHSSVITRCWGFELQNGKSSLKSPQTLATQDFAPASFLSTPDKKTTTPKGVVVFLDTLRNQNARAKWIRPAPRFCLWQNACTAQRRRRPEGRLDASQEKLWMTLSDLNKCMSLFGLGRVNLCLNFLHCKEVRISYSSCLESSAK